MHRLQPDIIQGWMYHGDLAAMAAHLVAHGRLRRRLCWNIRASNVEDARYTKLIRTCGWLSGWPDVIVANSEAGAKFHTAHGYRPRRIVVIPNGIDTDKFRPDPIARAMLRAELGLGDQVVAVHVARVDPMKDHATFLSAMTSLPGISGLLVGAGTESLVCPANVRALGVTARRRTCLCRRRSCGLKLSLRGGLFECFGGRHEHWPCAGRNRCGRCGANCRADGACRRAAQHGRACRGDQG